VAFLLLLKICDRNICNSTSADIGRSLLSVEDGSDIAIDAESKQVISTRFRRPQKRQVLTQGKVDHERIGAVRNL
jgi:hypothetical protein